MWNEQSFCDSHRYIAIYKTFHYLENMALTRRGKEPTPKRRLSGTPVLEGMLHYQSWMMRRTGHSHCPQDGHCRHDADQQRHQDFDALGR